MARKNGSVNLSTDNPQQDALEELCDQGPTEEEFEAEDDGQPEELGNKHEVFAGCQYCLGWWGREFYWDGPDAPETKKQVTQRLREDHATTGCKGEITIEED